MFYELYTYLSLAREHTHTTSSAVSALPNRKVRFVAEQLS